MNQESSKGDTIGFSVLDEIMLKGRKYKIVGKDTSDKHPCADYKYFNYILEDVELKNTLHLTSDELEDMIKASA